MSKELETKVAIRLLEKKIASAEVNAETLCEKVISAEHSYKAALADYTIVVDMIENFKKEIANHGKA